MKEQFTKIMFREWRLSDICHREIGISESEYPADPIIELFQNPKINPCKIKSPLFCFKEGSSLLQTNSKLNPKNGYEEPYTINGIPFNWTVFMNSEFKQLEQLYFNRNSKYSPNDVATLKLFHQKFEKSNREELTNIDNQILDKIQSAGGHCPTVSGEEEQQFLTISEESFQSSIYFMSPNTLYKILENELKEVVLSGHTGNLHGIGNRIWWSEKVAAEVLHKWNLEMKNNLDEYRQARANNTDLTGSELEYGLDSPVYIEFNNNRFDQGML